MLHAGTDTWTVSAPRRSSVTTARSTSCARDPAAGARPALASRFASDEPSAAVDASAAALPLDIGAVAAVVGLRSLSELEQQVVKLKAEAGQSLLLVEIGYKVLAFGEDAAALAPVLHMCSFRRGHFLVASFPLVRLEVHLLRLLHAGFRVSVARQTETAAQKAAGDAPHTRFARRLQGTFTLATYAPAASVESGGGELSAHHAPRWLLSIHESPAARSRAHGGAGVPTLHILAIDVATASVLYEEQGGGHPADDQPAGPSPPSPTVRPAPPVMRDVAVSHLAARDCAATQAAAPAASDAPRLLLSHMLEALSPVEIVVPRGPLSRRIARELAAYVPTGGTPQTAGHSAHATCCSDSLAARPHTGPAAATTCDSRPAGPPDVQPTLRLDREEEESFTVEAAAALVASTDPSGLSALLAAPCGLARALGSVGRRLHQAGHASLLARAAQTYEHFRSHGCMRLGSGVLADLHVLEPEGHSLLSTLLSASPNATPAAGRLLRRWLSAPLACPAAMAARHDAVEELRAVASEMDAAPRRTGTQNGGRGAGGSGGAALAVCRRLRARVPAHDLEAHLARLARGEGAPWQLLALCDTIGGALDEMATLRPPACPLLYSLLSPHHNLRIFISEWCAHLTPAAATHSVTLVAALIPMGGARVRPADLAAGLILPATSSGMHETDSASSFLRACAPGAPAAAGDGDGAPAAARAALYASHASVLELERHLETHELAEVRRVLGDPTMRFRHQSAGTAGREEYFIELPHGSAAARRVPDDWLRVNQTKGVVRFRPPAVEAQLRRLALARERREGKARSAWLAVQRAAAPWMQALRGLVGRLAQLDALLCLAGLARRHGYVRPTLLPDDGAPATLNATQSRHPLIEAYRQSNGLPYVPNDVRLGGAALAATLDDAPLPAPAAPNGGLGDGAAPPRCAILMGPNMGGKSSYCRQVGTLALLAQAGSFVPAESCALTPFHWLASRMGARDSLTRGVSTFQLELAQTAEALGFADGHGRASGSGASGGGENRLRASGVGRDLPLPSRSLLLLDEVGRGTATHDGAAIAHAVLEHISDSSALCVFTTHYPEVADLAAARPSDVAVFHMDAVVGPADGGASGATNAIAPDVRMLHRLVPGVGDGSYGIRVGRLAGLPAQLLAVAAAESDQMRRRLRAEAIKRKQGELERLVLHMMWLVRSEGTAGEGVGAKELRQLQHDLRCALLE